MSGAAFGADTDPIAANVRLLDKATAYWYACGYNDHRGHHEAYVDPFQFAEHWLEVNAQPSHASLQATFKAFKESQ